MRELTDHRVNATNDLITLEVLDGPGPGGASHEYIARLPDGRVWDFNFQYGPIGKVGVNGLTHEVLLSILIDRLTSFQAGPYANEYNAAALSHLLSAQKALHDRTRERMARGVEGTHTK